MKTAVLYSKLGRKIADLEDKSLAAYLLELSRLVSQNQLIKAAEFIAEITQSNAVLLKLAPKVYSRELPLGDQAALLNNTPAKAGSNIKIHSVLSNDVFALGRFEIGAFSENDQIIAAKIAKHLIQDFERLKQYHHVVRDSQTGFWSRELFFDFLGQEFARSRRYQAPMSLILADIDGFSKISNAKIVLEKTAHRIRSEVRGGDLLARVAENTFAIIQPMTNLKQSAESAERLISKFKHLPILVDETPLQVHLSMGISSLQFDSESPHDMIIAADRGLGAAKRLGGNQIVVFDIDAKARI